jgi:hypothetical protein
MYKRFKFCNWRIIFFALLILLFSFSGFDADTKSSLTLSDEEIKAMIQKAEPLIEEVTGRKFKKRMKYKIVERAVLFETLKESNSPLIKKIYKNINKETIARQMETAASITSQGIMGLYLPLKKSFYVTPSNMELTMEQFQVTKDNFNDFVFLVVAHEMVHALDDQYFNLRKMQNRVNNTEEWQALSSLIEGQAVYVTELIADKLKLPETIRTFSKKITADMSDTQRLSSERYTKGYEFIEAIIKAKGTAGITSAFKSPPVSTKQILFPEEYLTPVDIVKIDYAKLIETVTKGIAPENMQIQTMALGAMDLRKSLISSGITQDEASKIAIACITGSGYQAVKPVVKPKIISIQIFKFKDSDSVKKLDDVTQKIHESLINQAKASLNMSLKVIKEEELKIEGYDLIRFRQMELDKVGSITKSIEVTGLLNSNYVSIEYVNMEDKTQDDAIKLLNMINIEYKKMTNELTAGL